jgi:hypothetical protein
VSGDIAPQFLTLGLDGSSGQLHAAAGLRLGKQPRYPLYRRLGGPQSRSGRYGEANIPLPLPGIEPRLLSVAQPVTVRYTDRAVRRQVASKVTQIRGRRLGDGLIELTFDRSPTPQHHGQLRQSSSNWRFWKGPLSAQVALEEWSLGPWDLWRNCPRSEIQVSSLKSENLESKSEGCWFFFSPDGVRVHLVLRPLFGVVPAPDDRWWWWWSSQWNAYWQGKPKYSEKTCPITTFSTTNPTWPDPGLNPGRRRGKPATNRLNLMG